MATKQGEKKPNLHAGHRGRMRNKFIQQDLEAFEMHEILELLLFYALPQKNTNELGHILINHFGSISAVFDASIEELCSIPGVKENTAVLLKLIPDIAREYIQNKNTSNFKTLESMEEIIECAKKQFAGTKEQRVYGVMLDNTFRVVGKCLLAKGDFDSADISPEMVVHELLRYKVKNIILTHNHPEGMAIPSHRDVAKTKALEESFITLGISLIEHVIIGRRDYEVACIYSYGYLQNNSFF